MKSKNKILLSLLFTLFPVAIFAQLPDNFTIKVPRPDSLGSLTLVLEKYSIRDTCFAYWADTQTTYIQDTLTDYVKGADFNNFVNHSNLPQRTYRGRILEQQNSAVIASVMPNGTLTAAIYGRFWVRWNIAGLPLEVDTTASKITIAENFQTAHEYTSYGKNDERKVDFDAPFIPYPSEESLPVEEKGNSPHGFMQLPAPGLLKVQLAMDLHPRYAGDKSDDQLLAEVEHAINLMDFYYARDVAISFRLTGVVRRYDSTICTGRQDLVGMWNKNGLGINYINIREGNAIIVDNMTEHAIPFQQLALIGAPGKSVAARSYKPSQGGNLTRSSIGGGLGHETGHCWGGEHWLWKDVMGGGGAGIGATSSIAFIRNKNKYQGVGPDVPPNEGAWLPTMTGEEYGFNLHPHCRPDFVVAQSDTTTSIAVLLNDFDSNGDTVRIAIFDSVTVNGGTVQLDGSNLLYTPKPGYQGADGFSYTASDGELFNRANVHISVYRKTLQLHYDFEIPGNTLYDVSGGEQHGISIISMRQDKPGVHIAANGDTILQFELGEGVGGSNGWKFPDLRDTWTAELNFKGQPTGKAQKERALVDMGNIVDPLSGSQSISVWFKPDSIPFNDHPLTIMSNNARVVSVTKWGWLITVDHDKVLNFEAKTLEGKSSKVKGDTILVQEWNHAVFVIDRDAKEIRAYQNGVLIGSKSLADGIITGPIISAVKAGIGAGTYNINMNTPFIGTFDEVRIYGRALTDAEAKLLYTDPLIDLDSAMEITSLKKEYFYANSFKEMALAPNPVRAEYDNVTFHIHSDGGEFELSIFDALGNEIFNHQGTLNGDSVQWDCRNQRGRRVASGTYLAIMKVTARNGEVTLYRATVGVQR